MRGPISDRLANRFHDATVAEIAAEKASSLGRAGRRLEAALTALHDLDPRVDSIERREELLDEAGEALFFYLVQREACGLRDSAEVLDALRVPRAVQLRMGIRRRKR